MKIFSECFDRPLKTHVACGLLIAHPWPS